MAGVSTHLFLTVLRDYDHDATFSVTYTDALGTHTKPYHAGMEVTAWSPVTITCTNHHVYDWSIDADVQEATIVGVGGITYPGGTGIHVKGTNTIKAFATNFGLHYINIVVISARAMVTAATTAAIMAAATTAAITAAAAYL